jgi:hypothetical protein
MPDLMKRGLSYRPNGDLAAPEKYAPAGTSPSDLPPHGMGRCEADCQMQGEHDWFLTGNDPVVEIVPDPPKPTKKSKGGD